MDFIPIVKPVGGDCNLNCAYCYFIQKMAKTPQGIIMPTNVLRELINQTCAVQKKVEFIWHGGEPILAGMNFYQQALKFQMPWIDKGAEIYNSIQTNGTLFTDEWLMFLQQNHFSVGLSIDGPEELHDRLRRDKHGRGTV